MDDKTTISTFQLFQMFPDAESARVYLESRLWPNGCLRTGPLFSARITVGNVIQVQS